MKTKLFLSAIVFFMVLTAQAQEVNEHSEADDFICLTIEQEICAQYKICAQISYFYFYFQLFIKGKKTKIKSSRTRKHKLKGGNK